MAMTGLERAIAIFGTQAALARATKRWPQEIYQYLKDGTVPMKHCQVFVAAIRDEIPRAIARGIEPDVARPVSYHELNAAFPSDVSV